MQNLQDKRYPQTSMFNGMSQRQWIESLALPTGPFKRHLGDVFDVYQQPKVELRWFDDWGPLPDTLTPQHPLGVQDRHTASGLSLERVIPAPFLLEDMIREFCPQFELFLAKQGIPQSRYSELPRVSFHTGRVNCAAAVCYVYTSNIGEASVEYASRLHVSPIIDEWAAAFDFGTRNPDQAFLFETYLSIQSDYSDDPIDWPDFGMFPETLQDVDPSIRKHLQMLRDEDIDLASLTFYPPSADGEMMMENFVHGDFKWTKACTDFGGASEIVVPKSLDWCDAFWSKYVPPPRQRSPKGNQTTAQKKNIWIPSETGSRTQANQPKLDHFIQRAWNRAVETDCTFLLVSCGTKERIGIRHRETNTLMLSDTLDPSEEIYPLAHLAFHSAVVRDALNRKLSPSVLAHHNQPTPRRASPLPRLSPRAAKNFDLEVSRRAVILLSFDMGVYCSPNPSAFLRKTPSCTPLPFSDVFKTQRGGRKCHITNTVIVELKTFIGSGAQGSIYRAKATLHTEEGTTIESPVVIKVANTSFHQANSELKREYAMYRKLAESNASKGILKMYGLFEDPESGIHLLMMQDGGQTLVDRSGGNAVGLLSDSEFKSLSRTIQAINGAGILHNDVKCDNILIDDRGIPYIIDLGIAKFTSEFHLDGATHYLEGTEPPTPHALKVVAAESASATIRSYDLQSVEDIYLGQHYPGPRYPDG